MNQESRDPSSGIWSSVRNLGRRLPAAAARESEMENHSASANLIESSKGRKDTR